MSKFPTPSKAQLEAIVALTQGAAGLIDEQARVLYLNTTLLGYPLDFAYRRSVLEGMHPDDLPYARKKLQTCLECPDKPVEVQLRKLDIHGSPHVLNAVLLNKLHDPDIKAIVLQCRDVTEIKASEAQRRYLASIVENSGDAILGCNLDGFIQSWNRGAERLYGYVSHDVVGRHISIAFPPDRREEVSRCLKTIGSGGHLPTHNSICLRHDGTVFDVSVTISPITDTAGSIVGASAVVRDISAQLKMERQIQRTSATRKFLAEIGNFLTESLQYEATISKVLNLSLDRIGDWCSLELVSEDGSIERSMAHSNPDFIERVNDWLRRNSPKPDPRYGSGRVLATGEPIFSPRITDQWLSGSRLPENMMELVRELEIGSFIAVPLKARGRTLGVLSVARSRSKDPFDLEDLVLLKDLAARIGLHIDNARLYRNAQREQRRSAKLAEISALLAESLDSANVLERLAQSAVDNFADYCVVYRIAPDGHLSRAAAAHADPGESHVLDRLMESGLPAATETRLLSVIDSGQPSLTTSVMEQNLRNIEDEDYRETMRQLGPRSSIIAPLIARGNRLGALSLVRTSRSRRFSRDDLRFVEELADRAAIAIDNERLYLDSQEAGRLKDHFLATLSHELRTPLTAIAGWSAVLRRGGITSARFDQALSSILRNVTLQTRLVEDLLDISRIVTGKMRIRTEPIDLPALIAESVMNMKSAADAKSIPITVEVVGQPRLVSCDPDRMQQIFWNLLSNAIKFTAPKGHIRVMVCTTATNAEIVVSDTGIGISSDFLPHVFERFRQLDGSNTRQASGLGLGLSIVKHLVELHGGFVHAESSGLGKGATFRIVLPRASESLRTKQA